MAENNMVYTDSEILAVIAAAIAAMETRPGYKLVVKSMRQVPQTSPVWNTTGRLERLGNCLNNVTVPSS